MVLTSTWREPILVLSSEPPPKANGTMDNASWEMAIAFLPPLMAATVTSLGLWFSERRKDRDAAQQRRKSISEELTRVRYLRSWLKTYDLIPETIRDDLDAAREGVCRELVSSHDRLSQALQRQPGDAPASPGNRVWKRAFLVPLSRPSARALRWVYWFFLVVSVLFTLAFMTSGYETADGTPTTPLTVFASGFILFVMFFAFALVFRASAVWIERRAERKAKNRAGNNGQAAGTVGFPLPVARTKRY